MSKARPMKTRAVKLTQAEMYALVRSPVITEKATHISAHRQVAFRVPLTATKPEIKAAVEGLFKVKVLAVNTLRHQGKIKMFRRRSGQRSAVHKAVRTL